MNAPKSVEREAVARELYYSFWARQPSPDCSRWEDQAGAIQHMWRGITDDFLALSGPVSGMDTSSVAEVPCSQAGSHTGGLTPLEALKQIAAVLAEYADDYEESGIGLGAYEACADARITARAAIAKAEATATEAQHPAGREPFGLTEAEAIAFMAGWNARETGSGHRADGRESCLGMFASGFNFGDSDIGEDISREPLPPPAAPPSPAPPSSEREGSRAGDRS